MVFPGLMDLLVPIATSPIEISGRQLMTSVSPSEAIPHTPRLNAGNYTTQALRTTSIERASPLRLA